ncbi:polysaccharide deacetylase family protein [Rhizobium sp. P40RR-XXII]|nr:polysaccharide deacetylase family protein [Rhizobium sp. P28RR-XV]NLS21217.1 polysaccharide deacetylase family protein [Rhizobium sp. P40RR-XXII]
MPISILRYSQIADPAEQGIYLRYRTVSPSNFRIQMRRLKRLGFTGLSLRDLQPYLRGEKSGRVFGITFDNGFRSVHTHALPILQELQFTATSYFVASQVSGFNIWDSPVGAPYSRCMSKEEILEWMQMGQEVGAHSLDHIALTEVSTTEARRQSPLLVVSSKTCWELRSTASPIRTAPCLNWSDISLSRLAMSARPRPLAGESYRRMTCCGYHDRRFAKWIAGLTSWANVRSVRSR